MLEGQAFYTFLDLGISPLVEAANLFLGLLESGLTLRLVSGRPEPTRLQRLYEKVLNIILSKL